MIRVVATGWAPQYPRAYYEAAGLRVWRTKSAARVFGPRVFDYYRGKALSLHFGRTYFCIGRRP